MGKQCCYFSYFFFSMVMLGVNEIFEQPQGIYVCYMPKAVQGSSQTVESASELG